MMKEYNFKSLSIKSKLKFLILFLILFLEILSIIAINIMFIFVLNDIFLLNNNQRISINLIYFSIAIFSSLIFSFLFEVYERYIFLQVENEYKKSWITNLANTRFKTVVRNESSIFNNIFINEIPEYTLSSYAFVINAFKFMLLSLGSILTLLLLKESHYSILILYSIILITSLLIPLILNKKYAKNEKKFLKSRSKFNKYVSLFLKGYKYLFLNTYLSKFTEKVIGTSGDLKDKKIKKESTENQISFLVEVSEFFSHVSLYCLSIYLLVIGEIASAAIIFGFQEFLNYTLQISSDIPQSYASFRNRKLFAKNWSRILGEKQEKLIWKKAINNVAINNLSFEVKNKLLFRNINFQFSRNNHYLIKGDNGTGKTAFLNLVRNIEQGYNGNIFINDTQAKTINEYSLTKYISYTSSNQKLIVEDYEVDKNSNILEKFLKIKKIKKIIMKTSNNNSEYSSGERQIINIILAISSKADVLIFDEALSNLDRNLKYLLLDILLKIKNKIFVFVEHDDNFEKNFLKENILTLTKK